MPANKRFRLNDGQGSSPVEPLRPKATYWRQRNDLVQSASRHIVRMQKTMTQMNVQLANVLSDVSGATGQAIIKAILAGERDPHKPAAFGTNDSVRRKLFAKGYP